ncbi:MAG: rod shape-determining protein MreD [Bacteroidetes bacterium]|nr:rod shape-determining protein MreD [Bacteroidota bacterium]
MINLVTRNIIRFLVLVLFQVLVLNNIYLSGFINPNLYILFILLLPVNTAPPTVMLLSFFIGLSVDIFSDTGGMHAAASVFLAFCRPYILKLLSPREGYEYITEPAIKQLGFTWFLVYIFMLVLSHHLVLFYVEVFRFSEFFYTFAKVLLSTVTTVIIIFLVLFLVQRKKE